MSIEIRAQEVYRLATTLRASAGIAEDIAARLGHPGDVGALRPAVEAFLDSHRTAGRALASELQWLGDAVAVVADSWFELDAAVFRGKAAAR